MQYIASLSYGKDSLAMLHVICDVLKLPLTRIITADVWATETIPAELPPMVEFKEKADRIIKERWGIEVEHFCATKKNGTKNSYNSQFYTKVGEKIINKRTEVFAEPHTCHNPGGKIDIYGFPMRMGAWCNSKLKIEALNNAKKTYEDVFYHVRESGKREGQIAGFPYQNAPECNSELKRPVFKEIEKQARGAVQYIGIAADEPKRIERHQKKEGISMPLVDAGWTEQMCRDWCKENELLSPIYTTSARGGCWFCHNQGIDQLRQLRKDYPDLWALLLKWDNDSPATFHADGKTVHDFERRFQWEDDGYKPCGNRFAWNDINEPQMNLLQFMSDDGIIDFNKWNKEG